MPGATKALFSMIKVSTTRDFKLVMKPSGKIPIMLWPRSTKEKRTPHSVARSMPIQSSPRPMSWVMKADSLREHLIELERNQDCGRSS